MPSQALINFEPHQFDHRLAVKKIEGGPLLYYIGDLAGDCAPPRWQVDGFPEKCKRARDMRKAAWNAYSNQQCHLAQRKLSTNHYEYWAIPGKPVAPLNNEDIREAYLGRMGRGGIVTAAVKRGGVPYARAA